MHKTIYLKADRNIEVNKSVVTIGDLFETECTDEKLLLEIKKIPVFNFKESKKIKRTVISVLKVISDIHESYPNCLVQNLGETDIIITCENQKTESGMIHWIKVIVIFSITFTGSAFSIMTFNNDVQLTLLFSQIYELFTGKSSDGVTILEFTYSIGLVIGILVFFNHFGKKRFSIDPTPIEVEMRLYENDIQTTIVETYARKGDEVGMD